MNLDQLITGQSITVQDGDVVPGHEIQWSRQRGTRVHLWASRLHPQLRNITITIDGSNVFYATEFNSELQAFVSHGRATRIVGVTGPWREVRHPEDATRKMAIVPRRPERKLP